MKNPIRRLNYWFQTLIYSLLLMGVLILVFQIAKPFNQIYDWSSEQRFSFSSKTQEVLNQFQKEKIQLTSFFKPEDPLLKEIESLLPSLQLLIPGLTFANYDLEKNPEQAKKLGVHADRTLLVEKDGRRANVSHLSEEGLRMAFEKLAEKKRPLILFIQGHGEVRSTDTSPLGYSFLRDYLLNEAYQVKEDFIESSYFSQADLVILSYPKRDLSTVEQAHLKEHLKKSSAIFMMDPEEAKAYPNLRTLLADQGAGLGDDVILDRTSRAFGADDLIPVVTDFSQHEIVRGFEAPLFFPLARSVRMLEGAEKDQWESDYLLFSGKESWGESDYLSLERGSYSFEEGKDQRGPLALGLAMERKGSAAQNRLLLFGDSDFVNNTNIQAGGNRLLFLNSISWVLREKLGSDSSSLRTESKPCVIPASQDNRLFLVLVVAPTLTSFFIFGGAFFLRQFFT